MTHEITHDISQLLFHAVLSKLITLVVIAIISSLFFQVLQLPSSGVVYSTELEQLLK